MTKINAPTPSNDEDGKEEKVDEDGKPLKSSRNKKKKNKKWTKIKSIQFIALNINILRI